MDSRSVKEVEQDHATLVPQLRQELHIDLIEAQRVLIDSTVDSLVSGFSNVAQRVIILCAVTHGLEHLEDESLEEVRRLIQDRC